MSVEIRAAREEERAGVAHMIDVAFDGESYGPGLKNPCRYVGHSDMDPHDRPENTQILLVGGEIVAVVHVAQRNAYACGDVAPFGFIAMVATHPEHRRKGHAGQLLREAEEYMRSRGLCYAVMLGGFRTYCGSLDWRLCSERFPSLPQRHVVPCGGPQSGNLSVRLATVQDIPHLSRFYDQRYARLFGPVIRSADYWRLWSLECDWEGRYVLVLDGEEPVGYFHVSPESDTVDEIGWAEASEERGAQVFKSALEWGRENGRESVIFYFAADDNVGRTALWDASGTVTAEYYKPNGQRAEESNVAPFLPANWPDGMGILVKHLRAGPGLLGDVRSTDDLTETMAQHSWMWFDGDTM